MADDCWAATERNATGYPYPEVDHFPNGMKQVIDYVHSKYKVDPADHLVFGLYTCGGKKTCVGGRVGSEDFWEKDAAAYAEWGVDWVKMDWVSPPPPPLSYLCQSILSVPEVLTARPALRSATQRRKTRRTPTRRWARR